MEINDTPELNFIPAQQTVSSGSASGNKEPELNMLVNQTNDTSNVVTGGGGSVLNQGTLTSPNYKVGSAGWKLDSNGDLEASSGTFRGTLSASTGTIGGWSINATSIYTGTEDHSGYTANAGDLTIYSDGSDASIHAKNFYLDTSGNLACTSATISGAITTGVGSSISGDYVDALSVAKLSAGTISSKAITLAVTPDAGDSKIQAGKTDFTNSETGFILGIDDSDSDKAKFYCGTATDYVYFDGTSWIATNLAQSFAFTAGEALTANDALSIINVDQEFLSSDGTEDLGTGASEKLAQSFQTALTGAKIWGCMFAISKNGSPVDNVYVTLEADSKGSPSGTPLATSQSVNGANLATGAANIEFIFATPYALTASTDYWLVLQRDDALSGSNYYKVRDNAAGGYTSGAAKYFDSPNWGALTNFKFATFIIKAGNVYKSKADYEALVDGFVGFARAAADAAATVEAQLTGIVYKASWGLTEGKQYFLTDTAGAIGTTAGTYSKKVGKAITTEKLLIDKVVD